MREGDAVRMTKILCDSCGNEIPAGQDWVKVQITHAKVLDDVEIFELCTKCAEDLRFEMHGGGL